MTTNSMLRWHWKLNDTPWLALIILAAAFAAGSAVASLDQMPAFLRGGLSAMAAVVGFAAFVGVGGWARSQDTVIETRSEFTASRLRSFKELTDRDLFIHTPFRDATEFVERDAFGELCGLIEALQPVLVVGPSMAGKSRLAAEAVRKIYPDRKTLMTVSGQVLMKVLDSGARPVNCVIWMEDFERFLSEGLTAARVEQLHEDNNALVATMRTSERIKFNSINEIKQPGWNVLLLFGELVLDGHLSANELRQLDGSSYADIIPQASQHGLAGYLGNANAVWERFQLGKTECPLGWASVLACADWYRITRGPITDSCLEELAPAYLAVHQRDGSLDRRAALDWAQQPQGTSIRLLNPAADGSWLVFDYVQDRLTLEAGPVPAELWETLKRNVLTPEQGFVGASSAYQAKQIGTAEILWQRTLATGHSDAAPRSVFGLGTLNDGRDNSAAAEDAYQAAIATKHPDAAAPAALALGLLRAKLGNAKGAEAAYEQAIAFRHTDVYPRAALSLGLLRQEHGDQCGARQAYALAINSQDPDVTPRAALALGGLLQKADPTGAEKSYQVAIASRHPDAAPRAALACGALFEKDGRPSMAAAAYQVAIDANHPDSAANAAFALGGLREEHGDLVAAAEAYQLAVDSQHGEYGPRALLALGRCSEKGGDREQAIRSYRRAIGTQHKDIAPRAALVLGRILEERIDRAGAEKCFQLAVAASDPEVAAAALAAMENGAGTR